jgi:multiple sugar transport system permease protein
LDRTLSFAKIPSGAQVVDLALPLVRPGIVATAILAFTTSWNNFLFALVLTGPKLKTAPVAVFNFISFEEYNWGAVSAAALLITLPVLAFVFLVQRPKGG